MSFQEKRSLVTLIGNLVISIGYFLVMFPRAQDATGITNDLRFWASFILILIPVSIVFNILFHILFVIINVVATREETPDITDEFDKLVNLKSTRNFYHVFMIGFALSLLALVVEQPPYVMFIVLNAAIVVASITQSVSEIYYYRRGV
jgi:hypothetical protein